MIKVSMPNLQTVIRQVKDKQKDLKQKGGKLLDELAEAGSEKLDEKLAQAVYDGSTNVGVMPPEWEQGTNKIAIGIAGEEVTFIEFGTGTHYADNHPLMGDFGFTRGTYGKGLGANPPWYFRDTGVHGNGEVEAVTRSGAVIIKTYGNPANRVVYDTGKELREEVTKIAEEVYSK